MNDIFIISLVAPNVVSISDTRLHAIENWEDGRVGRVEIKKDGSWSVEYIKGYDGQKAAYLPINDALELLDYKVLPA